MHDWMPVILAESTWPKWLGQIPAAGDDCSRCLSRAQTKHQKTWPVGAAVGNGQI
jgi:putative SOS response-associated peptidase YedK